MVKLLKINNKLLLTLLFITIIPSKLISNRIVGYYPSWVQNQYPIGSVDFSTFSHLIHAFAWPNNQVKLFLTLEHLTQTLLFKFNHKVQSFFLRSEDGELQLVLLLQQRRMKLDLISFQISLI